MKEGCVESDRIQSMPVFIKMVLDNGSNYEISLSEYSWFATPLVPLVAAE